MDKYTYTLIIPHYNIHTLLRRLLNTVPRRDDLQVIVVDDCSTKDLDELEKVKSEFPWVEWYDTGTNGGGGKARNIGLTHAQGKYLIFADSDDFFNLCFNDILDKYKDTNYDIIYFAVNSVDTLSIQNNRASEWLNLPINQGVVSNNFEKIRFFYTTPWCKFILRKLTVDNDIQFHETIVSNDVYFSTQIDLYAKHIHLDNHSIYTWTTRIGSVSRELNIEKLIIRLKEDDYRREVLKQNNIEDLHANYLPEILNKIKNLADKNTWIETTNYLNSNGYSNISIFVILLKYRLSNYFLSILRKIYKQIRKKQ